jgi:hypothetical protein
LANCFFIFVSCWSLPFLAPLHGHAKEKPVACACRPFA